MKIISLTFLLFCSQGLWAADNSAKPREPSEFYVPEGLAQKIYEDLEHERLAPSKAQFLVGIESTSMSEMFLKSRYFGVDYSENVGNLQSLNIGFSRNLTRWNRFLFDGILQAGYAYKKGLCTVKATNGLELQDDIGLQWIPIRTGIITAYQIPETNWISPEIEAGLGSHWFTQTGNLDGMTQSFWVPTYFWGLRAKLFDQIPTGSSFGGVIVGTRFEEKLGDTQRLRQISYFLTSGFSM